MKPAYAELEREARNELKKRFSDPSDSDLHKCNSRYKYAKYMQWILDGTL